MLKNSNYHSKTRHSIVYYIGLALCIGIILIGSLYWVNLTLGKDSIKDSENAPPKSASNEVDNVPAFTPIPTLTPAISPTPTHTQVPVAIETINQTPELSMPCYGEIINPFSGDELVYSKTMADWRTHKGIDIKSSILSSVMAAGSGTVEKVYDDPLMGITIIIRHSDKIKSVYSNLSTKDMVSEGKKIVSGEIISGVGDTAIAETGEEAHLHFELIVDGKKVDPSDYLG